MVRWTKDVLTRFTVGAHSYGVPTVIGKGSPDDLIIGKFCSFADGSMILINVEHRTDWATTYPFPALPADWPTGQGITGHPRFKGPVVIENDVWVGLRAVILSNVVIGNGACIGACSVVTKDVPPYSIVAGNPAKVIRYRFSDEHIQKLLDLKWWDWDRDRIAQAVPFLCKGQIDELLTM